MTQNTDDYWWSDRKCVRLVTIVVALSLLTPIEDLEAYVCVYLVYLSNDGKKALETWIFKSKITNQVLILHI